MTAEAQDLVCNPDNMGFADLGIKPISFGHKAHQVVEEITWMYGARDVTKRETANAWKDKYLHLFKHNAY